MIIIRLAQPLRILQNVFHAANEVRQEFSPFRVTEQRPPHGRNLHQTRQRLRQNITSILENQTYVRRKRRRQRMIEIKKKFKRRVVQKRGTPASRYLHGTQIIQAFVRRGADKIKLQAILGQSE